MTAIARSPVVPVLRVFDGAEAREVRAGVLGVARDWEHRSAPDLPPYAQVSRGALALRPGEHHDGACPAARLRA